MEKIIKLTEIDLYRIVKKVLNEQGSADVNIGLLNKKQLSQSELKYGNTGDNVKKLQQALMDIGLLKTDTMVPTGYFGDKTLAALKQFQIMKRMPATGVFNELTKSLLFVGGFNNNKSTSTDASKPINYPDIKKLQYQDNVPKTDYLGKGGQFERQLYGGSKEDFLKMKDTLAKIPPSKKSSLPLHVRALMDYLNGRETPFTAADLTTDEQKFLKSVALPNAKKGLTYPLWKEIGAGNLPTSMTVTGSQKEKEKLNDKGGQGSLIKPELAGQFMYTLGEVSPPNIKVGPNKDTVTIYDRYDFNTQGKTKEDLMKSFSNQLSSFFNGDSTFYSVVRNAVAFKETNGYKGFPVNITV